MAQWSPPRYASGCDDTQSDNDAFFYFYVRVQNTMFLSILRGVLTFEFSVTYFIKCRTKRFAFNKFKITQGYYFLLNIYSPTSQNIGAKHNENV